MTEAASFRRILVIAGLTICAALACSKSQESLIVVSLLADPAAAATSVTISADGVSRTFALTGGLSSTPITRGVYLPSSAGGAIMVEATATSGSACPYQGSGTADIAQAGATASVTITLRPVCTDGGVPDTTGAGGAGGASEPPSLGSCTEYDHDVPAQLPCDTNTGVGDWLISSVVFSPDGSLVVSAGEDGRVKIWRFDGQTIADEGHAFTLPRQSYLAFTPDGTSLIAGTRSRIISWTVGTWTSTDFLGVTGDIYDLRISSDGQEIVSVDSDMKLYVHEIATPAANPSITALPGVPYAVDISHIQPNGSASIAVAFSGGGLQIYDFGSTGVNATPSAALVINSDGDAVNTVRFSPDGQLLVVGSDDGFASFYSVPLTSSSTPSGASPMTVFGGPVGVLGVDFSVDGRYLSIAAGTPFVGGFGSIWGVGARTEVGTPYFPFDYPLSTAFSPNGAAVVYGEIGCGKIALCID